MSTALTFALVCAGVAVVFGAWSISCMMAKPPGNVLMREFAAAIQTGAQAYLNRQYTTIGIVGVVLLVIIGWALGARTAAGFAVGAILSGLAGFIGMNVSVRANVRTAEAARSGLNEALAVAFRGGAITGLLVVGLGLLGVAGFYLYLVQSAGSAPNLMREGLHATIEPLVGLAFGGSLISIFARLGGGIFTKGADVGADLVGKVEAGIPEDDPRNPAVIADNVGDNVGDCAGMAADLFETYAVTIVATMLLGALLLPGQAEAAVTYPLALGGFSILRFDRGLLFRQGASRRQDHECALPRAHGRGRAVRDRLLVHHRQDDERRRGDRSAADDAASVGRGLDRLDTDCGDGGDHRVLHRNRVQARASRGRSFDDGPRHQHHRRPRRIHEVDGVAGDLGVRRDPRVLLAGGTLRHRRGGDRNAVDDGHHRRARRVRADHRQRGRHRRDGGPSRVGARDHRSARCGRQHHQGGDQKGYAIGSAGLAALVLFADYTHALEGANIHVSFDLSNHMVIVGLFLGGLIPYLFGAMASGSGFGRAAGAVVVEVRRQFKEIPSIMAGTAKPEHGVAVEMLTKAAIREMLIPSLLPVLVPVIVGLVLGPQALGGLLMGTIITGLFVAISMTTGGGAWDNAKKYIEDGHFGGKGSDAHKAAVTGDTVGDPYKDTAGPAVNPLIKIINIVALMIVPLLALNSGADRKAAVPAAPATASAPAATPSVGAVSAVPAGGAFVAATTGSTPMVSVYFASGASALPGDPKQGLAPVIDYLNADAASRASISGFHDATGNADQNQELAKQRALNVREALKSSGVAEDRIEMNKPAQTLGGSDDTEARRVDVTVK